MPHPITLCIQSPRRSLYRDAKISDLIDAQNNNWNEGLIDNIIWPEEVELIKSIPLSVPNAQDHFIWH